jgi:uncharacterized membrane protein
MRSPSSVERVVARILRWGGLLSVALMLSGLVVYVAQGHLREHEAVRVVQNLQAGRAVDVFTSLSDVWRGLRHQPPDGLAIAVLGLLCLIATPVAGVAAATLWFWQQRDRPYALISAVVLAMLLLSLILAGGV